MKLVSAHTLNIGEISMRPRERLLQILKHKKADHVPWFGDLDYWATSLICRGLKPEDFVRSDAYLEWHRELGVGFYLQGCFPFKELFRSCNVTEEVINGIRSRTISTPIGSITERWKWLPNSFSEAPIKHFVETDKDLKIYQYAYSHLAYEPDYEFLHMRKQQIGDYGVLLAYMPKSPLMQLIALDSGIMNVVLLEMQFPSLFHGVINCMKSTLSAACSIVLESPAEIIMIPENLSSEMVGPHYFETYMRDYQSHWSQQIQQLGKYSCIHMDGTLKGLLKEVCSVGLSFIEACTPDPVGDVPVEEWDTYTEDNSTIMWGGIPGPYFTDSVADEEFIHFVERVLTVMRRKPQYVLGVADQVPPDALTYRVAMVRELVEEYGRYE